MNYLDLSTVTARKTTEPPLIRSRSGYGSKLPTPHMVQVANRWHRVYVVCWSNSGTAYIRKGGESHYIATGEL
jgi:hypothetical protein